MAFFILFFNIIFHALMSEKCLLWMRDLSTLASWWMATLCQAIWSTLRNLFLHMDSRWSQVSMLFLGHVVQFGLVYIWGHYKLFGGYPMYWAKWNLKCVLFGHLCFKKFSRSS